jgi:ribosome maturation factor RimP
VDFELKNENGWILRVYVEKLGALADKLSTKQAAIDLSLCTNIARDLSPALDVADPIPHRYSLEVSSPGIERPLKKTADFERFAGEKAKLKLRNAVAGQKVLVGTLGPVNDGKLAVTDGGRTFEVPLEDVTSARLVFEFGPASRPQPHRQKKKRKS